MKNLKLFLLALATVSLVTLVSCDNGNEPGKGEKPNGQEEQITKTIFELKNDDKVLKSGDIITVTKAEAGQMDVHFVMKNNSDRPIKVTLKGKTTFDENVLGSSFCTTTSCTQGTPSEEQIIGEIYPNQENKGDYHLILNDGATTTSSSSNLTFKAGEEEIKVTVKFELK